MVWFCHKLKDSGQAEKRMKERKKKRNEIPEHLLKGAAAAKKSKINERH